MDRASGQLGRTEDTFSPADEPLIGLGEGDEYLLRHRGTVVSREMLARDVWKASTATWTNVIEVQIRELRKKIERPEWPRLLHTVRGEGYLLGSQP